MTGKPAELRDETSPDWTPSLKMGYGIAVKEKDLTSRYN